MTDRRQFIKLSALGAGALVAGTSCASGEEGDDVNATGHEEAQSAAAVSAVKPIVISTWIHGMDANAAAWEVLENGGYALDAVEAGVRVTESDAEGQSVGVGGLPDRTGVVTLDACIQDENSDCGAVSFLQNIEHPISVARKVMEDTPHVMLSGKGALAFAREKGFEETDLLTEKSKAAWEKWKANQDDIPAINRENHDTIGQLALDADGRICGACTTSGAAWKLHGRVGDSPIIGAGLFVDGDVGGACATGLGEAVIRVAGSAMVVELMRNGTSPAEACKIVTERIVSKHKDTDGLQVGFLALNLKGEHGGYSVYNGFNYALTHEGRHEMIDAPHDREWE